MLMTWPEVADSAVKIGLGALVGGGFSLALARLTQRHEFRKLALERRWTLLQQVQLEVTDFSVAISAFWASTRNAAYRRDASQPLSAVEQRELKELENKAFAAFGALATPRSKLLLLGEKDADAALGKYRESCDAFFRVAELSNPKSTQEQLDALRADMLDKRTAAYDAISTAYLSSPGPA